MGLQTAYVVEGLPELRRKLRRVGGEEGKALLRELKGALAEVSQIVAAAGRPPNRTRRSTGRTRSLLRPSATTTMARVQVRLPYAAPVHFGWPNRGDAPGVKGGPIPANPWLLAAARQTQPEWLAVYENELRDLIRRIEND